MDRLIISSILRKLPLKLLLIILALFGVFMFCFSSADNVEDLVSYTETSYFTPNVNTRTTLITNEDFSSKTVCLTFEGDFGTNKTFNYGFTSTSNGTPRNYLHFTDSHVGKYFCLLGSTYFRGYCESNGCNFKIKYFVLDVLMATELPSMSSLQCQTEYNLIPISSVDQNYCTTNNLCPTYDCPTNPIGTGTLSNLYINNILHIGAPNIIMNIPEEIDWDYAYTQGGTTMNIDVVGYNQDQEMIQGWIDTNNYKPTSEDFTNIFTNFSNFGGLLIGALFVILVFYFIKKLFK